MCMHTIEKVALTLPTINTTSSIASVLQLSENLLEDKQDLVAKIN